MHTPNRLIEWIIEDGEPRVLTIFQDLFASSETTIQSTYQEFVAQVGQEDADAALARFYEHHKEWRGLPFSEITH